MAKNHFLHVYTLCKNEIDLIPFFLAHYENIADRIIFFDNESTDGSQEYIKKHPKCSVIEFRTNNLMRDDILRMIKNSVWKESKGDAEWVIVADIDEFLYHRDIKKQLTYCKENGISIPLVEGFNMISSSFPKPGIPITKQVKFGTYSKQYSKNIVFDPNKITEINYRVGGHSIEPEGEVNFSQDIAFKLLHYKYLGPTKRLQERWDRMGASLSEINKANEWTLERSNPAIFTDWFGYVKKHAELVVDTSFKQWHSKVYRYFKKRDLSSPC